jgi:hypothetical protein
VPRFGDDACLSDNSCAVLTDHLGSVTDITTAAGALLDHINYDAFGNTTSESQPLGGDRYGFGRSKEKGVPTLLGGKFGTVLSRRCESGALRTASRFLLSRLPWWRVWGLCNRRRRVRLVLLAEMVGAIRQRRGGREDEKQHAFFEHTKVDRVSRLGIG